MMPGGQLIQLTWLYSKHGNNSFSCAQNTVTRSLEAMQATCHFAVMCHRSGNCWNLPVWPIFTSTTQQLCKVLAGLRSTPGTDADKLLFVSSSARRFLCKHWPAGTPSTTALPACTFQLAPTLANMQCVTCR